MSNSAEKASELINSTIKYNGKELANELDVYKLVQTIFEMDQFQILEDLAFASKYSTGLFSVLRNNTVEVTEDYKSSIQSDFSEAVDKVREILNKVISKFSEQEKISFETRYLTMSQNSFSKLYSLIEDFAKIKIYLNSIKRKV
jgi:hypothetical protein